MNDELGRMGEGSCLLWSHFRYYPGSGLGGLGLLWNIVAIFKKGKSKKSKNPQQTLFRKETRWGDKVLRKKKIIKVYNIHRFCLHPISPWTCTNCFRDHIVDWFYPCRRNSSEQSITQSAVTFKMINLRQESNSPKKSQNSITSFITLWYFLSLALYEPMPIVYRCRIYLMTMYYMHNYFALDVTDLCKF